MQSGFQIAQNRSLIGKIIMVLYFAGMTSSLNFLDVIIFPFASLDSGPSFITMTGSGVMTILVYIEFDQRSRN